MRVKFRYLLPGLYMLVAIGAWVDFARLPPDGLASLGLWLVVFPVAILDLMLRSAERPGASVFIPDGLSYYPAHAVFFAASVTILSLLLYVFGRWIDRRVSSGARQR